MFALNHRFLALSLLSFLSVHSQVQLCRADAFSDDGRPPLKFACAPGQEVYGDPKSRTGKLMCVSSNEKGRYFRHGMYIQFDSRNEVQARGTFWEDKKQGKWVEFNKHGDKRSETLYDKGKIVKKVQFNEFGEPYVKFDANDPNKRTQSTAKKGKPENQRVFYGVDGRPL